MLATLFLRYRLGVENLKLQISEDFGVPDLTRENDSGEGSESMRREERGEEDGFRYML